MKPKKVTLYRALLHVGYARVAPRTLSRGNNLVQLKFSSDGGSGILIPHLEGELTLQLRRLYMQWY
ncbi:hypothetical protein [Sulfuracidifex metallicus]|uniref:hypothetical protein n=1 Tax=Sulfuracidifex metallicus TaxID=47303 RepID=UPI0006D25480|nr:hypothetical protein [Sulfuracidifex metallicus]